MTALARALALVLGVLLAACAWLPWSLANAAIAIPSKTLWDPGTVSLVSPSYVATLAFLLWIAGGAVIIGAVIGSRAIVIIGGLIGAGVALAWVLANAISTSAGAVTVTSFRVGAYTAIGAGIAILLVAALSRDTALPTAR